MLSRIGESLYWMARNLERADNTARILDINVVHMLEADEGATEETMWRPLLPDVTLVGLPLDYYQWGALLKSLSGFESYRRRYQGGIRPIDVIDFVVLNPDFPRSLMYCVEGMERVLQRVDPVHDGKVDDCITALRTHLADTSPQAILDQGLHEYLDWFLVLLANLTEALQADYFEAHGGEAL